MEDLLVLHIEDLRAQSVQEHGIFVQGDFIHELLEEIDVADLEAQRKRSPLLSVGLRQRGSSSQQKISECKLLITFLFEQLLVFCRFLLSVSISQLCIESLLEIQLGEVVERRLVVNICSVRVCSLVKKILHELDGPVGQVQERQGQEGTAFLVLAIHIYIFVLQKLLHAALVILEHGNVDWSYPPRVLGVDVGTCLQQQVDAVRPAVGGSVVQRRVR